MRKEIWTFDDMLNMVTTAANEIAVSEFTLIVFLVFGPHSHAKPVLPEEYASCCQPGRKLA